MHAQDEAGRPGEAGSRPMEHGPSGDDDLYRRLFQVFYRPVYYFFARRGFGAEDCRDLAQDTFLRVYRGLPNYRSEAGHRTWILAIARNLWLNRRRDEHAEKRQRLEVPLSEGSWEGPAEVEGSRAEPSPEDRVLRRERRRRLQDAIRQLPPQARRCQVLRLEGLKYREIATVLGISLQAVRSHLFQARQRLERIVGEPPPNPLDDDGEGSP
ncbi:MAG: RNA polymerase sigma factor [Acidobacteriota bacterium]